MNQVRETIILAPGANKNELIKTLAKFNKPIFATRIVSSVELANIALDRSGKPLEESFVPESSQAAFIYNEIKKNISYFKRYVYLDAWSLMTSINNLRMYLDDDNQIFDLKENNFKNKNEAIKVTWNLYKKVLRDNNYIDEIGTIRKAISIAEPLSNVDFIKINEFPLHPLEEKLLNHLSNNKVKEISLSECSELKVNTYTRAFGSTNEIENVLSYIYERKIPLDQCLVVATEPSLYSKILLNYKDELGLNLTIGYNESVFETNAGKLFSSITEWDYYGYYKTYLKNIIYAAYFDIEKFKTDLNYIEEPINDELPHNQKFDLDYLIDVFGNLKLSFEKDFNEGIAKPYIELTTKEYKLNPNDINKRKAYLSNKYIIKFINILNKGIPAFIERYTVINPFNKIKEEDALVNIVSLLLVTKDNNIPFKDVKSSVAMLSVGSETSKEGYLHVTSIEKAKSSIRPYVFIVGLSNNYFPGGPKEDPIVLDEDYEIYNEKEHSKKLIEDKKKALLDLLSLASTFSKEIHLSYSVYNSETLKSQSCSSMLLKIYQLVDGENKTLKDFTNSFKEDNERFKKVTFFDKPLLGDFKFGQAYINENNKIINNYIDEKNTDPVPVLDYEKISLSASRLQTFLTCKRKFYLMNIVGIPEEYEENMYDVLNAIDAGNLAHELLKNFSKKKDSLDDLIIRANKALDEYFITHTCFNELDIEKKREEFINMIKNAYEMDDGYETFIAEEDYFAIHEGTKIKIHGFPDKVVIKPDGTLKVIDYKTKNSIEHNFKDLDTTVQLVMYSYIITHNKKIHDLLGRTPIVSEIEYRYIKLKIPVVSTNMEILYNKFDEQMQSLKDYYSNGIFDLADQKECNYCKFKALCRRGEE